MGAVVLCVVLSSCGPRPSSPFASRTVFEGLYVSTPEGVGMRASLPAKLDSLLHAAIADSVAPGAALAVGRHGRLVHLTGYGRTDWNRAAPAVTARTMYDLASLTKVVATTTAAMILEEEGRLDLRKPVAEFLSAFGTPDKAAITVRSLLTHRSGMATAMLHREAKGRDQYLEKIIAHPMESEPGTRTRYSDFNMIVMQLVMECITGRPLDEFLQARVFGPLGMHDTAFKPDAAMRPRIAPTEVQELRGGLVHGEVHDENAWAMGGVAGHAGLFSSARDLSILAQMLLGGGEYRGVRILKPETVARWSARQGADASRALGWDTPSEGSSAGEHFSAWSFGHTGFTGTSMWMDPRTDLFVILLTNRVNPTRRNLKVGPLRRNVADAVQAAVLDTPLFN